MNLLDNKGVVKNFVSLPEGELGIEIQARFEAEEGIMVSFQCLCLLSKSFCLPSTSPVTVPANTILIEVPFKGT